MSNEITFEQMNEALGSFMGFKMYDKRYPKNHSIGAPEAEPEKCMIIQKAKYHSSWDSLMPVWKRLIDAVAGQTEEGDYPADFSSIMDMYAYHCEQADIASAHDIVYKGIEWYNKRNNK